MFTAIFLLALFQSSTTSRVQKSQMDASATVNLPGFAEESQTDAAAYEEREFIQRLNRLSKALSAFTETYQSGQVDLKQVKALRKAMDDLEKSQWFRPSKTK